MCGRLNKSSGVLKYSPEPNNLRVVVDPEIYKYYRSLIPKWFKTQPQMYEPHVSVVRREPVIPNIAVWGKYEGEEIEFEYSHEVFAGEVYCWLNVFCVRLEEIRRELGLRIDSPFTRPPDGYEKCFHMTLGNRKN